MAEFVSLAAFAAGAGVATFFSPCAYALLPAYIGFFASTSEAKPTQRRVLREGFASASGALLAFAVLGVIGVVIGETLTSVFPALEVAVGVVLIGLGVVLLLDRIHLTIPVRPPDGSTRSFVVFGAGYATAAAGCIAPVFFAVIVSASTAPITVGVATVGVYAGTFAALLVALTLIAAMGVEFAYERLSRAGVFLTRGAGVVMILGGIIQLAIAGGWTPPAIG